MTTKELINQYVTAHADNRWMDASELEALLTEFAEKLKEPSSDDFESEWKRYCDSKGGGAVTMNIKDVAKHFAQWQKEQDYKNLERLKKSWFKEGKIEGQFEGITDDVKYQQGYHDAKEQMMKDAIHCKVFWHDGPLLDYTQEEQDDALEKIGAEVGDKVKVIIIKE